MESVNDQSSSNCTLIYNFVSLQDNVFKTNRKPQWGKGNSKWNRGEKSRSFNTWVNHYEPSKYKVD